MIAVIIISVLIASVVTFGTIVLEGVRRDAEDEQERNEY